MRIGLISDTHGHLRPRVFDVFDGVDAILHAGDVGRLAILDELRVIAPVTAVWGNTDGPEIRREVQELALLELDGRRLLLLHGHQLGSPTPDRLRRAHPDVDIIVHGHTHHAIVDRAATPLIINPGAAGPARLGEAPSVAVLELTAEDMGVRQVALEEGWDGLTAGGGGGV